MTQRPWMPMYWGDYLRDTTTLTAKQHGYYLLLIAYYWENSRLPSTAAERQRTTKTNYQADGKCWKVIKQYFTPEGRHKRIDKELEKFANISTKRKLSGMRGASQRWQMPMPNAIPQTRLMNMAIAPHTYQRKIDTLHSEPRSLTMLPDNELKPTPALLKLLDQQNRERGITPARSATALPSGAPPSPAIPSQSNGKAPHTVSKQELEALYAARASQVSKKVI